MRAVRVACAVVVAAALFAAGCGGDDGPDGAGAAGGGEGDAPAMPLSGIPAASPAEATACLRDAGLDVDAGDPPAEDAERGAVEMVEVTGANGAALITWFASEEEAAAVHAGALQDQQPNTTVGRTGEALYVASGEDFSAVGRSVTGCL